MKSVVIHRQTRTDRIPLIAALLAAYPGTQILEAKVPVWETNLHNRAMRGCTVSHLSAVRAFLAPENPLMVFEDDAVPVDSYDLNLEAIPHDAGIIIYGGDAPTYGENVSGFREVIPPFFGTQAVLYTPRLLKSEFLLNALEIAASVCVGIYGKTGGLCFESILLKALGPTGLKVYRPNRMGFTVAPTPSDSGSQSGTRSASLVAEDRDRASLLPVETWDEVFVPWAGKKVHLIVPPGNPGDQLIHAATRQLFRKHGIVEVTLPDAEVLMYAGGGNAGGQYAFAEWFIPLFDSPLPKVVLPQTFKTSSKLLEKADIVWARDTTSVGVFPSARLTHDLSLAYRASVSATHENPVGVFFRIDAEKTSVPENNLGDPGARCRTHHDYLMLAGKYKAIHTNRLHFAVAGLIMGCEVTLYANSYHKNLSVYERSLKSLGCKWGG